MAAMLTRDERLTSLHAQWLETTETYRQAKAKGDRSLAAAMLGRIDRILDLRNGLR